MRRISDSASNRSTRCSSDGLWASVVAGAARSKAAIIDLPDIDVLPESLARRGYLIDARLRSGRSPAQRVRRFVEEPQNSAVLSMHVTQAPLVARQQV